MMSASSCICRVRAELDAISRRHFFNFVVYFLFSATTVTSNANRATRQLSPQIPPPATGTELHYAILEELPVKSPVADIVADAGLHAHGIDVVRSFRFRLINQQQQQAMSSGANELRGFNAGGGGAVAGGGVFMVGESTGVVSVSSRLDREAICHSSSLTSAAAQSPPRCIVRLDIAVQPMTYFQIIKVSWELKRDLVVNPYVGVRSTAEVRNSVLKLGTQMIR